MQSGAIQKKQLLKEAAGNKKSIKPSTSNTIPSSGSNSVQEPNKPAKSPLAARTVSNVELNKLASRTELFVAIGLCLFVAALYIFGRIFYDDRYYTPEEGLGYWLGITGGVMMLLAFAYTAFKYVGGLRTRAVMKHWLTIHIFFGIMGPILILVHSTFHIGSLNGGIAFVTMLLVLISGIIGRFLYSRTHYGLGGSKARVKDLQEMLRLAGHKIKSEHLERFTESMLVHKQTLGYAFWDWLTFGWRSRWLYFRMNENMRASLKHLAEQNGWDNASVRQKRREFKRQLREYIMVLKKVALFRVYERFFAFWRNAHVPLLYLLLMSGIVHVIAVHMY